MFRSLLFSVKDANYFQLSLNFFTVKKISLNKVLNWLKAVSVSFCILTSSAESDHVEVCSVAQPGPAAAVESGTYRRG